MGLRSGICADQYSSSTRNWVLYIRHRFRYISEHYSHYVDWLNYLFTHLIDLTALTLITVFAPPSIVQPLLSVSPLLALHHPLGRKPSSPPPHSDRPPDRPQPITARDREGRQNGRGVAAPGWGRSWDGAPRPIGGRVGEPQPIAKQPLGAEGVAWGTTGSDSPGGGIRNPGGAPAVSCTDTHTHTGHEVSHQNDDWRPKLTQKLQKWYYWCWFIMLASVINVFNSSKFRISNLMLYWHYSTG